ncbi:MAG TPA: lactonase family protein [Burkholderiales bacterium]|nr:lactonase family protein [Burkholderiales bacterium]
MASPKKPPAPRFAYVGCFSTEKRKAKGKGVALFRIDGKGKWTFVEVCDVIPNPSFIALHPSQRFLYSAHGDSDEVCSYARDPQSGKLTFLNKQKTEGDNSSTVEVHRDGRWLLLSTGPGVAIFPIKSDGSLGPHSDLVVPEGEIAPLRDEQEGPHPHQAIFDLTGKYVIVPDKGLDRIQVFRFDAERGKITTCDIVEARYGAVPRHFAFHPSKPYAYLLAENDSTVFAFHWNTGTGKLKPFQRVTTLPDDYVGNNMAAEIAILPSGKFLYASNRGHESIAIYAVRANGTVKVIGWEPVQGKKPRFFCLSPDASKLYAANEDSHTIVEFRVNPKTGKLKATGQIIQTGSPTCVVFAS